MRATEQHLPALDSQIIREREVQSWLVKTIIENTDIEKSSVSLLPHRWESDSDYYSRKLFLLRVCDRINHSCCKKIIDKGAKKSLQYSFHCLRRVVHKVFILIDCSQTI